MKRRRNPGRNARWLALAAGLIFTLNLRAIVLGSVTVICPVCGEQNVFYGFEAWGGYVYYYASRFQMVFFPHSYPTALWTCKRCHYTRWAWDFKQLPPEKVTAVRKALDGTASIPAFENYAQVPMSVRLALAERVYHELVTDDLFWSQFYRVKGYHLGLCNKTHEARQARLKSRDLLVRLMADPKYVNQKKDLLVALAAMDHFTGDDQAALATLAKAASEPSSGDDAKGNDQFLSKLIVEYTGRIESKSVPSDEGSVNLLPGIAENGTIESSGERIWTVRACDK